MSWFSQLFKKKPESTGPEAFVRFDFVHTFPHVFWVSSVSYDSEAPDGFRYKLFATRPEPEMVIEILLLRERLNGFKRTVSRMEAPIGKFATTTDLVRELEKDSNVEFERFDLTDVRTLDELTRRAYYLGWETARSE